MGMDKKGRGRGNKEAFCEEEVGGGRKRKRGKRDTAL